MEDLTAASARLLLQFQRERAARASVMARHSMLAVGAGILIIVGGGPTNVELNLGVLSRPVLGYLAIIAGTFLWVGPRLYGTGSARGKVEALGLVLVGLWYALFAVALVNNLWAYDGPWVFSWPWELKEIPYEQPRLYTPLIYLTLCSMVWGDHLRAVLRDRRLSP